MRKYLSLLAVQLILLGILSGCATTDCGCGRPSNPHLTLNLGPEWACAIEPKDHSTTVCQPTSGQTDRIIIWSIKAVGKNDSLAGFERKLSGVKISQDHGASVISQPMSQKRVLINGQSWIDALQYQSEIAGFFTRYLATTDDDLAVLVTFSAKKASFADFNKEIQPVIETLLVRR